MKYAEIYIVRSPRWSGFAIIGVRGKLRGETNK